MNEQSHRDEITDLEAANAEAIKGGPRLVITKIGCITDPDTDVVGGLTMNYMRKSGELK